MKHFLILGNTWYSHRNYNLFNIGRLLIIKNILEDHYNKLSKTGIGLWVKNDLFTQAAQEIVFNQFDKIILQN